MTDLAETPRARTRPNWSSIDSALTAGLRWTFETDQTASAIIHHHGAHLHVPAENRTLRFIPIGAEGRVVVVLEVATVVPASSPQLPPTNPLRDGELEQLHDLLQERGFSVADSWNGHPYVTGSVALDRPAHPGLIASVLRYQQGCQTHDQSVFCRCGWYAAGYADVALPEAL